MGPRIAPNAHHAQRDRALCIASRSATAVNPTTHSGTSAMAMISMVDPSPVMGAYGTTDLPDAATTGTLTTVRRDHAPGRQRSIPRSAATRAR